MMVVLLSYFCSLVHHQVEHALNASYNRTHALVYADTTHNKSLPTLAKEASHPRSAATIPENECVTCRLWNEFSNGLIKAPIIAIDRLGSGLSHSYAWDCKDQPYPRKIPSSAQARAPPQA